MHLTTVLLSALAASPLAVGAEFAKSASKKGHTSIAPTHKSSPTGKGSSSSGSSSAKVKPYHRPVGPLDTPWTSSVSTSHPWPEYPRPQMRRPAPAAQGDDFASNWLNLNGLWEFQGSNTSSTTSPSAPPKANSYTNEVLVPYCQESALSGIMERHTYSWYRTTFRATDLAKKSESLEKKARVLLNFQAVDYEATVFVNGQKAGFHRGGYLRFTIDVSDYIYWDDTENVLEVFAFDPTDTEPNTWDITVGKQTATPSHIFYTPCSGIWQTVWLETVPRKHITYVALKADMNGKVTANITVANSPAADPDPSASATASHKASSTSSKKGESTSSHKGATSSHNEASSTHSSAKASSTSTHDKRAGSVTITFLKPGTTDSFYTTIVSPGISTFQVPSGSFDVWSPDHPNLYNVTVEYDTDAVQTYVGFRTISQGKVHGVQRPLLNGEFVFHMGTLDQGFWPDGIYTAPTYDAMVYDLQYLKKVGFNMLRKHIKVEPDLFYEACDKMGLLLWQDQPCLIPSAPTPASAAVKSQYEAEIRDMIVLHDHSPAIAIWVTLNEAWGESTTDYGYPAQLVDVVRSIDTTRLVDAATGWYAFGAGDLSDNHHYSSPQCGTPFYSIQSSPYDPKKIGVQGEYGGVGLNLSAEHLWKVEEAILQINQTYELDANQEAWNYRALRVIAELKEQTLLFDCSAGVYTQTTDVEGEVNGLLSYDRRVARPYLEDWQKLFKDLYAVAKKRTTQGPPDPLSVIDLGLEVPAMKRGWGAIPDFGFL